VIHNMREWLIRGEETGLLVFLKQQLVDATSVKAIKRAIENRSCLVNGRIERFGSRRLKAGDRVQFSFREKRERALSLPKLYEDEHLLVVDKPPYFLCEDKEVQQSLAEYKGKIWLAHRLDKETSGVLLLAKSQEARERLKELFAQRKIEKRYIALVHGLLFKDEGEIRSRLVVKKRICGQTIYGSSSHEDGEEALTLWRCLQRKQKTTLVECQPITGRTHQIRVHMHSIGHPIVGDLQYGLRRNEMDVERCLLHALQIKLVHPFSGKELLVKSPLPKELKGLFQ
jgi:23S rRNA pseudouridine955/2504/2580 synthase